MCNRSDDTIITISFSENDNYALLFVCDNYQSDEGWVEDTI